MKKYAMAVVLAVLGWAVAAPASAALLMVVDGNGSQVPAVGPWPVEPVHVPFESGPQGQMTIGLDEAPPSFPDNIPTGTKGYGGMFLKLLADTTNVPVTFTLKGHGDASFNNRFAVSGCAINWSTATTPVNTTVTCTLPANQLIPFSFTPNPDPANGVAVNNGLVTPPNTLSPGGNGRPTLNPPWSQPDFGLFEVTQTALNRGNAFLIGLSDGGGGGSADFDMQDMVVLVSVPAETAVVPTLSPVGAMVLIALLGVAASASLRIRRRIG
jgi:hypothetical protein